MGKLELRITLGIPGSGKDFFYNQFVDSHYGWTKTTKDDIRKEIRKELGLDAFARVNEKEVVSRQDKIIVGALKAGLNIVVCDTHLNPVHINERFPNLLKDNGFSDTVEIVVDKQFLSVPVEVCIQRDALREGVDKVGPEVINRMWKDAQKWLPKDYESYLPRLQSYDGTKPKAIIVDLDGTVALLHNRGRFEENKVENDLPNVPVVNLVDMYLNNPKYKVIFVSGRKDSCFDETSNWLRKTFPGSSMKSILFMRGDKDNRSDDLVKEDIYHNDIEPHYFVEAVVDDRLRVCRKWVEMGLFVFNVNQTMKEF